MFAIVLSSRCTVSASGGTLEELHASFQLSDFFSLYVFVHALALETASTSPLAGTGTFRRCDLCRSNDEIIELGQDGSRKLVNLELDLFGTLKE